MVLEIKVLASDRHNKKCGRVKPVNGILPSSIYIPCFSVKIFFQSIYTDYANLAYLD